jgi:hypothetical protein
MNLSRLVYLIQVAVLSLAGCRDETALTVPAEVRAAVVRQFAEVGIDAKQVDAAKDLFKPVDLTTQTAPDWLVDFNVLPSGQLCGTGGCPLQVWVKIGYAPYTLAFDNQVISYTLARHDGGRHWLALELNGVLCGRTGSDDCHYDFEWHGNADDPDGYFAAASVLGKPARYLGPLAQALPSQAPAGSAVAAALTNYRAACKAAGGLADLTDALVRLPDLNRDGRPEWLFDASRAYCQRDDSPITPRCRGKVCQSQLFTDSIGQGWHEAWLGAPFSYAIDYSDAGGPRMMISTIDCTVNCSEHVLTWQDTSHH